MCSIGEYYKLHPMCDDSSSSVNSIPIPDGSITDYMVLLGHTLNGIDIWIQSFEENYDIQTMI